MTLPGRAAWVRSSALRGGPRTGAAAKVPASGIGANRLASRQRRDPPGSAPGSSLGGPPPDWGRAAGHPGSPGMQVARRAGAFCALAVIAVVVPALMTHLCGWPLPRHLPTGAQIRTFLADPLSPGAVLCVLAGAIWLTWAMLAVSVAAEILAALRGHPAPRLPVLPPAQALAAALVSALALSSAATARMAMPAGATASSVPVAAAGTPRRPAAPRPAEIRARRTPASAADATPLLGFPPASRRSIVTGDRVYQVAPGDTLWSIAAAELGNPWRWPEIYHLNRDRAEPDGQRLADPALIFPGWTLLVPAASARSRPAASHPEPRHRADPAGPAPAPRHPAPGRHRAASRPPAGHPGSKPPHPGSPGPRTDRGGGIHLPGGGLAGITLAVAVSAALVLAGVQRRRRYRPAAAAASSLRPDEPPLPAAIAALRRAATSRETDLPLPGPGRLPAAEQLVPVQPGVVVLGVRDGQEIPVDIAALGGLGLTGPGAAAAARAILAGLLAQALPGHPAGPAEVIMTADGAAVLFPGPDGLTGVSVPGLVITPTLDAALGHAEALLVRRARHTGLPDPGDSTGEDSAAPALPATVLIATPPRASQRLRGVLESGCRLAVAGIVLGEWPPGGTCHVTADGMVTSADPALDGIQMFHLATTDSTAVLHLIQAACGNPGEDHPAPVPGGPPPLQGAGMAARVPQPPAAGPTPRPAALGDSADLRDVPAGAVPPDAPLPAPDTSPPPGETTPPALVDPRPPGSTQRTPGAPAIRVEVLGALRITTADREIEGGLRKARELLAFLAIHPGGASGEAISEALWPDAPPGHSARQRSLALRKLRDLLRAATGLPGPMFVVLAADRYRLDPALIATDVADFQAALDAARHTPDDAARLAALKDAAALYRGPLAEGAGYDWAEPYAETARRRALDTWTAIVELLEPAEPDQALAALDTALSHDPYNEYLYQRIMRIQAAVGRPDAVRRTLRLLETRLTELGLTPAAQTRQAAATLLAMPAPVERRSGPQPPLPTRPAPPASQRPPRRPAR